MRFFSYSLFVDRFSCCVSFDVVQQRPATVPTSTAAKIFWTLSSRSKYRRAVNGFNSGGISDSADSNRTATTSGSSTDNNSSNTNDEDGRINNRRGRRARSGGGGRFFRKRSTASPSSTSQRVGVSTTSTSGVSCCSNSGSEDGGDSGCGEGVNGFAAAPDNIGSTIAFASAAAAAAAVVPGSSCDGGGSDESGGESGVGSAAIATTQASWRFRIPRVPVPRFLAFVA